MSTLDEKVAELQEVADVGYAKKLIDFCGGNVKSAAILDLVIDGNYWYLDLRRAPFAGNEYLKEQAREAREQQFNFSSSLISMVWRRQVE